MPTGLQVKNDNGDIVIDEEYRNFVLKTSGSATTGTTSIGGTAGIYVANIAVTNCVTPLIAVRSTTYVSVIGTSVSGSTYTFTVASNTSSLSFSYWVFDVAATPSDTFGFAVYNSSGDLVFHSSSKPMRVVTSFAAGTTAGTTLATGPTYAVIQNAVGWKYKNVYRALPNNYRYMSLCAGHRWTGTTLDIPWPTIILTPPAAALQVDDIIPSGITSNQSYTPQTPTFVVVDVTNF